MPEPEPDSTNDQPMTDGALLVFGAAIVLVLVLCVLMFLIVTHVWAIAWWFFVPAWPLGESYTKGLLGVDQHTTVEARIVEGVRLLAQATRVIQQDQPYPPAPSPLRHGETA